MSKILVVGSVALDTVTTPFGGVKEALGGSAVYFSISAIKFLEPFDVRIVAVVGEDFPSKYLKLLKKNKIDTEGLKKEKGKTFRWIGEYDYNLNEAHTIDTKLNVFENFSPEIPSDYKNTPYIFLANIDPELQEKVLEQISSPKLVVLDTMNFWISSKKESLKNVLKMVDIFLLNESETRQISEEYNILKAVRKILSWGPKAVIVKRGEYGAIYFDNSSIFYVPSYPLENIYDPTGAGDSFAGGFLGYIAKKDKFDRKTIKQATVFGSIMGSFAVESFSLNKLVKVNQRDILERYREFKNFTHF